MVFVVAGGVRVENSREILALPSNVMVGAGFEMNTIDELRQNADLLIQGHSPRSEEIRLVERTSREPGTPQQGRAELRDAEELLYHVDEADNVLGSIARSSVQKTTPKPIFRTVQVIAVTPSGELVFQKRALLKKGFPGSMDFTSGHVIYGQDYAVSAAKEASEELPLTVAPEDLVRIIPSAQESFLKLRGEGTWQNRGVFVLPVSGEQTELIREKDRSLREFWDELYGTLAAKSGVTVDEFKNKVKTDEGYKKIVQDELIGRVGADNLANYEIEGYEFMGWAEAVRRHFENAPETPFADGVYGLFDARLNPVEGVEVYRAAAEKAIGDVTAQQRSELRADFTRTFQVFDPRETEVHLVANTALNGIFEADFEHNRGVIHRPDGKIEYTPSYGIDSKSPVESEWSELAAQLGKGTQGMTLISYHNIYYLDWFVAYEGKTGRLLHGFDEPYGVRTYSMFVQWNDGRVSSEDLTFRQKAGEGPDRVEVSRAADREAANPLGSKIRFAVFGQRLVQNGAAVPVENLASQFDDVFHLYRFPELQSKDESGGKGKFNDWFVRQFKGSVKHPMTAKDRPLLWEALKNGGYVTIDLAGLFAEQPALNIGDIKANALNKRGYTEVSERGKDQLAEGEYYIKENKLFIRLRPFPYPHDLIGITKSGKVVAIVLPGDKTKDRGYAIPRTSRPDVPQLQDVILQALPEDPIQDVFLLANSKDAFVWRDGAIVPELSSAKNYSSAPAAIAFVPKTRSEMRSPDEISPELAKLMAGTYLPQEIEAMPLEVKTQLLRDLMAGIPGRDLSAYDLEQKMLLLSGAPGSGKDLGAMAFGGKGITVDGKTLTFKDLFGSLLLYHSRMPRAGEINGSKYHFGHTDVGNPEKNRILRLLAQTGGDGQAPILEAYVNKQLQGVAVRRFVEKDLVLVNPGAEGSYDQILPTDENVRYNPDGTVTVDRPIVGLAEAFNANRLTYLEGGFHWFRQLSAKDPDIFTVFISSFSDEQLDLREKNQKILEAAYPGNPFKIAVAWNLLNVRRATQRTESIDLGNPEVYQALVQSVDAWVDSPLRTENPAEALKILGRKPFDKNGAPLDSEAAVVRNAELIESPQFIEAVNHLLRDYFGLDFRIDESNAARAKAIAYYVQKRLAESGRNDISVDLVIPTAENEKTGNFSKPQDMLNRVVEGIAQAFLQDQYSTGNRQGKGLRIVNEFAYGVLLAKDKDEIDRMINSLLVQHAETIANAYFAYVLNAINRINQMQAVANDMARQDELPEKADLIMVYGGGDLDGKVPASVARLYGRYAEGDKPTILLSGGGQGAVPEAETYRAELVKLGVPAEKILTETKSQDMDQNAGMSLALLEELGLNPQRIVFVHAPFHVLRGYEAAKTKFGDKVISVRAAYVPDFGAMSAKKRGEWEKALMKQAEKVAGTDIPEARAVKTSLEVLRGVRSELRDVSKSFVMEPERPVMAEAILRQIPDSWQRLTRVFYDGIVPFDVYEFAMQAGRAAAVGVVAALTGQPAYADGVNSPAADEKLGALTDRPETFKASPKFSVAGGVIGVRTGKVSDALILTPRFAFDRGAIAVVRTVFGDTPAVVVVRNEKDKNFVNELNQKLAAVNRPAIFTAGSAEDAIRLIEEQVARRQPGTKIKALVDASEIKEPVAAALIERLSDTMIVTQGIFQSFLNYAGNEVTKLINLVQAQFAVSRAA
jgi:hypothetical protein